VRRLKCTGTWGRDSYETCLCHELTLLQVPFERQLPLPISYKGISVDAAYKIDILVEGLVILEIKSVEKLHPIHQAQLLTYLRLSNLWLGLLINFNVKTLKEGIKRIVNG
jgi:GxxExxY protein